MITPWFCYPNGNPIAYIGGSGVSSGPNFTFNVDGELCVYNDPGFSPAAVFTIGAGSLGYIVKGVGDPGDYVQFLLFAAKYGLSLRWETVLFCTLAQGEEVLIPSPAPDWVEYRLQHLNVLKSFNPNLVTPKPGNVSVTVRDSFGHETEIGVPVPPGIWTAGGPVTIEWPKPVSTPATGGYDVTGPIEITEVKFGPGSSGSPQMPGTWEITNGPVGGPMSDPISTVLGPSDIQAPVTVSVPPYWVVPPIFDPAWPRPGEKGGQVTQITFTPDPTPGAGIIPGPVTQTSPAPVDITQVTTGDLPTVFVPTDKPSTTMTYPGENPVTKTEDEEPVPVPPPTPGPCEDPCISSNTAAMDFVGKSIEALRKDLAKYSKKNSDGLIDFINKLISLYNGLKDVLSDRDERIVNALEMLAECTCKGASQSDGQSKIIGAVDRLEKRLEKISLALEKVNSNAEKGLFSPWNDITYDTGLPYPDLDSERAINENNRADG